MALPIKWSLPSLSEITSPSAGFPKTLSTSLENTQSCPCKIRARGLTTIPAIDGVQRSTFSPATQCYTAIRTSISPAITNQLNASERFARALGIHFEYCELGIVDTSKVAVDIIAGTASVYLRTITIANRACRKNSSQLFAAARLPQFLLDSPSSQVLRSVHPNHKRGGRSASRHLLSARTGASKSSPGKTTSLGCACFVRKSMMCTRHWRQARKLNRPPNAAPAAADWYCLGGLPYDYDRCVECGTCVGRRVCT